MKPRIIKFNLLLLFILWTGCFLAKAQENNNQHSMDDECFNFDDACRSCIGQPKCQWCSQGKKDIGGHYCFSNKKDLRESCKTEVENPQNSEPILVEDRPLTEVDKHTKIDYSNIVQLRPQHIKLKLRKGVPITIKLTYRQVKDYPLDLYYLMDLSKSMLPDKKTLARLGRDLAATMRKLTSQFKLGFGSFVDKVMAPFVNIHPESLRTPCQDISCATPFSFRNNLKLDANDALFTREVENAQISSNLDSPEGGFDALMQAMVCEEEIGWRKNVRKIIVLSTDAQFHMAGDGKMAGVIEPNDKTCHLNHRGFYDKYDVYDYPSISQIAEVAQEKGINIIFAVKNHLSLYKDLSERIKDSAYGELTQKSDNVIKLVTKVYKSITGKVEIGEKNRAHDSPISLRFFSSCGEGGEAIQTNVCNDVTEGTTFDFNVEIEVTECPKDIKGPKFIEIGTLQDSVRVEIDLLCECGCEAENSPTVERNSPSCSRQGTLQCGVCECNQGFYGKQCQCSRIGSLNAGEKNKQSDPNKCRPPGSNTTQVCNGRGRCECEICSCTNANYYGNYCQCNRGMCRQQVDSNVECSGHGICDCNECRCTPGWVGKFCQCQADFHCVNPDGRKICTENGQCNCGRCECNLGFTGRYCEECPTCGDGKCGEFKNCVQCKIHHSGDYEQEFCEKNCSQIISLPSLENSVNDQARLCTFRDSETGCDFNFTYKFIDPIKGYIFYAQERQKCPEPINVLAISIGVVVGVVALGVLTILLWKLLTTIHDRREYSKFEAESKKAVWNTDNNPLYKPALTTVANPAFAGK